MEVVLMLILCLFQISTGIIIKDKLSKVSFIDTKDRKINIYGLNSKYNTTIKIPSDKLQQYKIDAGSSGTYRVRTVSGQPVSVSKEGIITPFMRTWYWYGNRGYSQPQKDQTADRIETVFYNGVSVVTAKVGDISFNITVTTIEYGEEYANNIMNA